jgi:imidazolonepropionase-like amidohydrolase
MIASRLSLCVCLAAAAAAQDQVLVLRGGTVLTVSGAPIRDGSVVVHQGKIVAVGGRDTPAPAGARVVDCTGCTVTPGLVDAGTNFGLADTEANEQGDEITPHLNVLDALQLDRPEFARARAAGVTAVQVNPGHRNVIGGLGAVVKTAGRALADSLVKARSGMRVVMGSEPSAGNRAFRGGVPSDIYFRRPTTRMGVVWEVRRAFYAALAHREKISSDDDPDDAPALQVLLEVLDKKLKVHTVARSEADLRTALRLAQEFGYETIVEEATEVYRCVDLMASTGTKVLIGSPSADRVLGAGAADGAAVRWHSLNLLAEAGVPFAIHTGANSGAKALVHEALFAVRNGLAPEAALRAVTLAPAQILGVDARLGSLEAGKDADVVVWSGDPFDPTSCPRHVFIGGEEVEP